mmetsp:Transcript_16643/g.54375  ORF Transcript_16643/g.54375 Transcript_16643/m.54375 type:complete len:137 (+) Transcript_16643:415-825(+)
MSFLKLATEITSTLSSVVALMEVFRFVEFFIKACSPMKFPGTTQLTMVSPSSAITSAAPEMQKKSAVDGLSDDGQKLARRRLSDLFRKVVAELLAHETQELVVLERWRSERALPFIQWYSLRAGLRALTRFDSDIK